MLIVRIAWSVITLPNSDFIPVVAWSMPDIIGFSSEDVVSCRTCDAHATSSHPCSLMIPCPIGTSHRIQGTLHHLTFSFLWSATRSWIHIQSFILIYPSLLLPSCILPQLHTGAVGIAAIYKLHWLPTNLRYCTKHVRQAARVMELDQGDLA